MKIKPFLKPALFNACIKHLVAIPTEGRPVGHLSQYGDVVFKHAAYFWAVYDYVDIRNGKVYLSEEGAQYLRDRE